MFATVAEGVTVFVHYLVMAYIVFGGFLILRWRGTVWTHGAIIVWAILSLIAPVVCPLTWLENYFRHLVGRGDLAGGFVDTYITGVLYPTEFKAAALVVCVVIVLVSWTSAYIRWRHAKHLEMDGARFG